MFDMKETCRFEAHGFFVHVYFEATQKSNNITWFFVWVYKESIKYVYRVT